MSGKGIKESRNCVAFYQKNGESGNGAARSQHEAENGNWEVKSGYVYLYGVYPV